MRVVDANVDHLYNSRHDQRTTEELRYVDFVSLRNIYIHDIIHIIL